MESYGTIIEALSKFRSLIIDLMFFEIEYIKCVGDPVWEDPMKIHDIQYKEYLIEYINGEEDKLKIVIFRESSGRYQILSYYI